MQMRVEGLDVDEDVGVAAQHAAAKANAAAFNADY